MDIELELREMIKKGNFKNQKEFSKWALVSESYITKWKNQGYIPDDIKEKFESEFGELIYKDTNTITINLYKDIFASAGYGTTNSELVPTKMNFDKEFLREIFNITDFKNLDIIRVIGDSMLPYIKDGEFIFVQKGATPKNGDTVIANIDDELYVKRYYKIPFEKWIRLESDNKEFPNIEIDTDEKINSLSIVGIVKSKIKLY